jgi:hypothetical protein
MVASTASSAKGSERVAPRLIRPSKTSIRTYRFSGCRWRMVAESVAATDSDGVVGEGIKSRCTSSNAWQGVGRDPWWLGASERPPWYA